MTGRFRTRIATAARLAGLAGAVALVSAAATAGSASARPASLAVEAAAPPASCKGAAPGTRRRWACFAVTASIAWNMTLESSPSAPCRSTMTASVRWSGSGGAYWIADDMATRRAWGPSRWVPTRIVMAGPATFDFRITGHLAPADECVPAETLFPDCGRRTVAGYAVGLLPSIALAPDREYFWTPAEYTGQRAPDYSGCGNPPASVQPLWVLLQRYAGRASFRLSSVPNVRGSGNSAKQAAAAKILATRVGRTYVLRARHQPASTSAESDLIEGAWTATVTLKRVR